MTLAMSADERDRFLAEVRVGILSVDEPGRGPLSIPLWYDHDPEKGPWFLTGKSSKKARLLRAAGRCSLCVQSEDLPYRYVSLEGAISEEGDADRDNDLRPMARRYLGEEQGDAYTAAQEESGSVRFRIRPERWLSVDYSKSP